MELSPLLLLLPFLLVGFFYLAAGGNTRRRRRAPAPRGLPIIGNLHQVGALPHRALRALAAANGAPHLLRLRLGQVPALVASSPAAAAAIMREHDHVFASRPGFSTAEILTYGFKDLVFAPYGEHWRHVRRLSSEHVLSAARSHRYGPMREQEVALLVKAIRSEAAAADGAVVDVSKALYAFTNAVICGAVSGRFSREDEGRSELFRDLIEENATLLGGFCFGDYFPALAWADALLSGFAARARRNLRRWDDLLEKVIAEHEGKRRGRDDGSGKDDVEEDFVDVLLALQEEQQHGQGQAEGFHLTRDIIKSLLQDMFAAGTDTSFITLEWAMSELVKNPAAMRKLQDEVRQATPGAADKPARGATTSTATPYLKAVVKETLRLHPPVPLLVPRECARDEDATVLGYHVDRGTRVFVNAWAIHRRPDAWSEPEDFRPERFLPGSGEAEAVDLRGGHFQLVPFGAGRRVCPGMQFALATVELALASMVRLFDWEIPPPGELDMSDEPGFTVRRRIPLRLVAKPVG
ncbi:cytochrome P450 71A1-like [Oryza brachyantha]|uniref:cytochrome P450 71A1-like n=1 Tax=Oryza brachyantha TaxID=4533 RepID=UPI001ADBF3D3|nr:cytochrome P450 71A1-like [Oryza brachyantha]